MFANTQHDILFMEKEVKQLQKDSAPILKHLENKEIEQVYQILESIIENKTTLLQSSEGRREAYTRVFGWVVITKPLIDWMASTCTKYDIKSVVHIACGFDLMGALLRATPGAPDVYSSDLLISHGTQCKNTVVYGSRSNLEATDAIDRHVTPVNARNTALLVSWPSCGNDFAVRALIHFRQLGGRVFIFIGEDRNTGGITSCTGDMQLYDELEKYWELKDNYEYTQWINAYDYAQLHVLKE